ncbi:MAG: HVO_A0114 family putative DNA-binding protein [Thermoplasmatota archaeon]
MEIVIERQMKGSEYREAILQKYGSIEALVASAKKRGSRRTIAQADLADLRLFDEDPKRLRQTLTLRDEIDLDDVRKLGGLRAELLKILDEHGAARISDLAHSTGKNKKNVSEAISALEDLGVVIAKKRGREKLVRVIPGAQIHIRLSRAASA